MSNSALHCIHTSRRRAALAFSSEAPVESLNPCLGIHATITRHSADGSLGPEGWHPAQRLTVEEAVRGFPLDAA
ncbi:MAG: hypothetical protein NZM11_03345 [Anaerolineales bacterium]|nr:hypothetical protein [Anaerolineales bacterium]